MIFTKLQDKSARSRDFERRRYKVQDIGSGCLFGKYLVGDNFIVRKSYNGLQSPKKGLRSDLLGDPDSATV